MALLAEDFELSIPNDIVEERYRAGFQHGLTGGQLDRPIYLQKSFRLGYRAAKLYIKELRRRNGIVTFPVQGRLRICSK